VRFFGGGFPPRTPQGRINPRGALAGRARRRAQAQEGDRHRPVDGRGRPGLGRRLV